MSGCVERTRESDGHRRIGKVCLKAEKKQTSQWREQRKSQWEHWKGPVGGSVGINSQSLSDDHAAVTPPPGIHFADYLPSNSHRKSNKVVSRSLNQSNDLKNWDSGWGMIPHAFTASHSSRERRSRRASFSPGSSLFLHFLTNNA